MAKWQRFRYLPVLPLGTDGRLVTGSDAHIALSRRAAAEGMVLLKNEETLLPLKQGSAVALFGKASVDYVKGGGGSGDVTVRYVRNLTQGMEIKQSEGKLSVYAPLNQFYRENVAQQYSEGKKPGYTVEPEIPAELILAAAKSCDTAIISICRFSEEAWDRKGEPNDGDFYLSKEEQQMVSDVCGAFDNIVVVLNVGGMVDTSWFIHEPKIKAVLLAWQGGMEGGLAEADILCGDINPCGKLTDTFVATFDDYPSSYNFNESEDYVCYTDDIFVGYRYFETIPGAAQKVNYPFGFGLSYTTFAIKPVSCETVGDVITAKIAVTNTGSRAGREVVQLYSGAPVGRLEMPKFELRGFQKTKLLQPGETETVTISIPVTELASYDEKMAAYILLPGEYGIYVGNCIRSLEKIGSYGVAQETVTAQYQNRCDPRKLPCRLRADGSYETLKMSEYDPVLDTSDWPYSPNGDMQHIIPNDFGTPIAPGTLQLAQVADGDITLDAFLDSLSDDQLITLLGGCPNRHTADTKGIGGIDGVGIPAVMTADGPAGLRIKANRGVNTTAWPVATLLACTWDPELIYEIGVAGAMELKENNFGMWLTPAINIHRSPLCGRNFEYYSEDPLVAGKLAAAMVRGIQSQRISACVKHFCVNNKETNRKNSDSRLSERALREIYIKAFEIVVKEGGVRSVMTAYNLMNGTYTSENKDLLTGILREEWGYNGLVLTDWCNHAQHYREALAGNNLRMPHGHPARLQHALAQGLITRADLVVNAKKVLELILWLD
ncbi:MAG: beta-glucosidase [Ruminococcaceae bacterium]|nr:beta-glucosidase [Oscillospiraceae bacterium]